MLQVKLSVDSLSKLDNHIKKVKKIIEMQQSDEFRYFIKNKCLNEVKSYARSRLKGTTNEEYYQRYIDEIFIRDYKNPTKGFEIVSNLTIEKPTTRHSAGYTFSISMAFEYGTGIVGIGSSDAPSSYQYNVNNNKVNINDEEVEGWWIPKDLASDSITWGESKSGSAVVTRGYEGMEIFRFSAVNIQQKLPSWIEEYYMKEVKK